MTEPVGLVVLMGSIARLNLDALSQQFGVPGALEARDVGDPWLSLSLGSGLILES